MFFFNDQHVYPLQVWSPTQQDALQVWVADPVQPCQPALQITVAVGICVGKFVHLIRPAQQPPRCDLLSSH